MEKFFIPLDESFELTNISRSQGFKRVKLGLWAPVRYIGSKPGVLPDELSAYLKTLPTERTHRRGGYKPKGD